jgi:hypothetical protein
MKRFTVEDAIFEQWWVLTCSLTQNSPTLDGAN